ncbi:MAG: hypothetical protein L0Y66_00475 [Myxococcaceae bacterium]|nr:hypothetical protein [Myxococcaceae bacterium]MCI0671804.1 hypothetical protein [Myxococcaceae bacterium]
MTFKATLFSSVAVAALVVGCGTGTPEEDIDVELCEHLAEGPNVAVTAVVSGDASGAAVSNDHHRYDISLTSGAGKVSFAVDHAGEFVFGLGADVAMEIKDPSGAPVTPEETLLTGLACTDIKKRVQAHLETVGTYTLTFGPSSVQVVPLVIEHTHSAHP